MWRRPGFRRYKRCQSVRCPERGLVICNGFLLHVSSYQMKAFREGWAPCNGENHAGLGSGPSVWGTSGQPRYDLTPCGPPLRHALTQTEDAGIEISFGEWPRQGKAEASNAGSAAFVGLSSKSSADQYGRLAAAYSIVILRPTLPPAHNCHRCTSAADCMTAFAAFASYRYVHRS